MAGLLLLNARVRTMDPSRPHAEAVAVRGERIVAVGSKEECWAAAPPDARVVDCGGGMLVPGFIDPHLHLAAFAAQLRSVECGPAAVRSIEELVTRLREAAAEIQPGEWLRAAGYDDTALAEGRHPTHRDLDRATTRHPIRLLHRSGHALVLNSAGMARAGITTETEEPPGGVIDRRLEDGEPTGLLLEMEDVVARAVPPLPRAELVAGMRATSSFLLSAGVTAVQDMGHANTGASDGFLHALAAEAGFTPALLPTAVGWEAYTRGDGGEATAPVKLMLRESGGTPVPSTEAIVEAIQQCSADRRRIAVHAVSLPAVRALVHAFELCGDAAHIEELGHRVEHAGVCPPDLARRIANLGLAVVSNPAFLRRDAERYRASVLPAELPHLYAAGALARAGVRVAAASDAPVAVAGPLDGIAGACTRAAPDGLPLPGIPARGDEALVMHTSAAAHAAGAGDARGMLTPERRADLALLDGELPDAARVAMTIVGGAVAANGGDRRA